MGRDEQTNPLTCIDLRKKFGHLFKITTDPAYDTSHVPRKCLDPWYFQIPCKFGIIWPYGGKLIAVEVDYHPQASRKLVLVPGVRLWQDGDQEKTFLFDLGIFDLVTEIVQPKKRKQLSEEQKARLADLGREFRFVSHGAGDQI